MLGLGSMEIALQLRVLFVKKLHVSIYGLRRKNPVFGVTNKARFKPVFSATEAG